MFGGMEGWSHKTSQAGEDVRVLRSATNHNRVIYQYSIDE